MVVALLLIAAGPSCDPASAGQSTPTIRSGKDIVLVLKADKAAYTVGDRIRLEIALKNIGSTDVLINVASPWHAAHLVIVDSRGRRVAQIRDGPEFRSFNMMRWAKDRGVTLQFIDPGKPMQNGKIESFHGRLRAEFLNHRWFHRLEDVQAVAEDYRCTYNHYRPHQTLRYETPARFAGKHSLLSLLSKALSGSRSMDASATTPQYNWPREWG